MAAARFFAGRFLAAARFFAGRFLAAARFFAGRFLAAARFFAGRFFAVDLRAVDFLAVLFFAPARFLAGRLFAVDFLAALRAPAAAFFIALMFSPFLASLGGFEAYSAVAAYLAVLFPEGSLTARDARDASDIDAVTSASITFNIASLHGEVHQFERTFARTSSITRARGTRRGSEEMRFALRVCPSTRRDSRIYAVIANDARACVTSLRACNA